MWSRAASRLLLIGAAAVLVAAPIVPAGAQQPAPFCQGGLGIALIDVPADGRDDPRARTYIVDHVEPGERLERRIRLCNGTADPIVVQLYPVAATIDGASFAAVEGRAENELSRWIDVAPSPVTVPAGGEVVAKALVEVPDDASGGERYAAIVAEQPPVRQPSGFGVASRVGIRVYLSVGGPEEPASDFVIESVQASRRDDGAPLVTARVRNTGERALDLSGDLRLTEGPGGLSGGPFPVTVGTTLLPGASAPVDVPLDAAIVGGPWTATITMRSGLIERRAQAQITFPDQPGEQSSPVDAESLPLRENPNVVIPLAAGLVGLLALLLLVTGLLTSRRRARLRAAG